MSSASQRRIYASSSRGTAEVGSDFEQNVFQSVAGWLGKIDDLNPVFDEENNRVIIFVDLLILADSEPELATLMLHFPLDFASLVVHTFFQTADFSLRDTRLCVRPVNASLLPLNRREGGRMGMEAHGGLQILSGTVICFEASSEEVWAKTVKCSSECCGGSEHPFKILNEGPCGDGGSSSASWTSKPICKCCGSYNLVEDRKGASLCTTRLFTLCLDSEDQKHQDSRSPRRTLSVKLQDDLAEDPSLTLGARIQVVGHLRTKSASKAVGRFTSGEELVFVAWNLYPQPLGAASIDLASPDFSLQSNEAANDDTKFVQAVEDLRQVLDSTFPELQMFWRMKLMVLLTAISATDSEFEMPKRGRLHMLVLGGYDSFMSAVIRSVADIVFADFSWIRNTDSNAILPKFVSDTSGFVRMEASELTLNLGGVACFSNLLTVQKQTDMNALRHVLESQQIVLGKDAAATTVPCPVSILGILPDSAPVSAWKGAPLLRHFDLVHHVREEPNEDFDKAICSFLFGAAADGNVKDVSALRVRMHKATRQQTEFDLATYDLISSFFHATRQAMAYGTASGQHYDVQSICRIAKASAQLRLSARVELFDAVLAVSLHEESRVAKGLPSVLGFDVLPNGRSNVELFGMDEVDAYCRLHSRIVGLCQAHGTLKTDGAAGVD